MEREGEEEGESEEEEVTMANLATGLAEDRGGGIEVHVEEGEEKDEG